MLHNLNLEASNQSNYNIGFSTTFSDVLVHLAQWQYWWWFWFSFLWCFYYLLFLKTIRIRALKMRPKIATSYRPHGKWGDFLACIVPAVWCINILTNSNLILRLIEWQNESSLFTVRIRGRQWYWIYKFDLKNFTDILSTPKNVGSNKWVLSTFGDLQTTNDYLHVLQLRSQSKWVKQYWQDMLTKESKPANNHIVSSIEQLKINTNNSYNNANFIDNINQLELNNKLIINDSYKNINFMNYNFFYFKDINSTLGLFNDDSYSFSTDFFNLRKINISNYFNNTLNSSLFFSSDVVESSRWVKKSVGIHQPIRIIKNSSELFTNTNPNSYIEEDLFSLKFGSGDNKLESKTMPHTKYLTLKQQRVKKKKIAPLQKNFKTVDNDSIVNTRYSGHSILLNNSIDTNDNNASIQYKLLSKNKVRSDNISITLSKRLLRTKKILVIPAHVNVTAITNSYDVVHSWFIPGLGLKFDCVPGRSTHHTFFIDSVGFYYGQCAEICGRYHHHMPIRLCALPFEHFLVWWQTFGVPKLLFTFSDKKFNSYYYFRKYSW